MKPQTLTLITAILIILACLSTVQALIIDSVTMNPEQIAPGETSVIKIGIENDAKVDVEDVSVVLDLTEVDIPFAPYDSASEFSIEEIREDKTKYAEFEIIALNNAKSGIYKIPLEINYREEGETQTKTKYSLIGITVSSEPIIGVGAEDGLLLKGQENEITIKIINKGLSDIKFLEIELGSSTYFNILSQKNIYIGDIDSDDFDSADFKLYFKDNTPNTINLPVSVVYKDAVNNKYTEDFNLQVRVYDKKQAIELGLLEQSRTYTYIGVVFVLVVIWIIYRKIKKRRKMKKSVPSS